jgi:hypothetical protein
MSRTRSLKKPVGDLTKVFRKYKLKKELNTTLGRGLDILIKYQNP